MSALDDLALRLVDEAPCHALAVCSAPAYLEPHFAALCRSGHLERLPPRGRWPERYVVTARGWYTLVA